MDPRPASGVCSSPRLPRASGDGPGPRNRAGRQRMAAPRERGWTRVQAVVLENLRGCPARAGMDPNSAACHRQFLRLPRASGDGPDGRHPGRRPRSAAPRERGWTLSMKLTMWLKEGCPARAGMDPGARMSRTTGTGLPRASGDGPAIRSSISIRRKAAPRERGWTLLPSRCRCHVDGCPARAGMDPSPALRAQVGPRLPRASGDGPAAAAP